MRRVVKTIRQDADAIVSTAAAAQLAQAFRVLSLRKHPGYASRESKASMAPASTAL